MDENKSVNPNGSEAPKGQVPDALNLDDFFSSFDFLDELESDPKAQTPAPAEVPAAEAPAEPAPAEPAPADIPAEPEEPLPPESLDFLDDSKRDIDDMLADMTAEPEKAAGEEADFQVDIPKHPVGNDSFSPAVTFIPDETADLEISRLYQEIQAEKGAAADAADVPAEPAPVEAAPAEPVPAEPAFDEPVLPVESVPDEPAPAAPEEPKTVIAEPAKAETKAKKAAPKAKKSDKSEAEKPEKSKKEKGKKNTAEVIRKTVLALAIITIIVSLGILAKTYLLDPYLSEKQRQEAADQLIGSDVVLSGTQEAEKWKELKALYPNVKFAPDMLIKYANLYAANQDMAGWITINNTGIDLPLVQGKDNSYYLRRNLYKKYTDYGVPFFDYRNDLYFLNRNTVVYGHNMRYSDKIFGMLENYKTIDGFKKAPLIQCNTIYEDYTWKVYAVFITNSEARDDNGYVFAYNFIQLDDAKFTSYIQEVNKRALYTTGVDINAGDNILTLSTCCYDFDSAKLVVVARLVRDGESTEVDTSLAKTNPNPKYPQAWYTAKGKTNPYANDPKWYIG